MTKVFFYNIHNDRGKLFPLCLSRILAVGLLRLCNCTHITKGKTMFQRSSSLRRHTCGSYENNYISEAGLRLIFVCPIIHIYYVILQYIIIHIINIICIDYMF